jgi:hypothetical protein
VGRALVANTIGGLGQFYSCRYISRQCVHMLASLAAAAEHG